MSESEDSDPDFRETAEELSKRKQDLIIAIQNKQQLPTVIRTLKKGDSKSNKKLSRKANKKSSRKANKKSSRKANKKSSRKSSRKSNKKSSRVK
jgi:hypothetical protein